MNCHGCECLQRTCLLLNLLRILFECFNDSSTSENGILVTPVSMSWHKCAILSPSVLLLAKLDRTLGQTRLDEHEALRRLEALLLHEAKRHRQLHSLAVRLIGRVEVQRKPPERRRVKRA